MVWCFSDCDDWFLVYFGVGCFMVDLLWVYSLGSFLAGVGFPGLMFVAWTWLCFVAMFAVV